MDFRFATFHRRGNFYIYRSGYILKKFRVKPGKDGLYHMTALYRTAKMEDAGYLREILQSGYWEIPMVRRDR